MKKIFILLLMMLSLSVFAQKKVAVYMTGSDPINEIVGNRLVDGLAKNGKYTAIERSASFLKALSKEHTYEREGAVDDNEIAELGRQFGVQYVCVASVLNVWQNEKYITARIIDAESAEVVATGSSNGSITNPDALVGAMNGLSESLLKTLDYNKTAGAKKVAVYVSRTGNRDVDIILGDQLVSGFASSGKYLAIERTNSFLSQLSKEQGYQQSGAVDDEDLIRLGKQFGVQYVCAAKTTAWGGSYFISARLINVATAEIVNSYNAENKKLGNSKNVVAVASEVAEKLSGKTIKEIEKIRLARKIVYEKPGEFFCDGIYDSKKNKHGFKSGGFSVNPKHFSISFSVKVFDYSYENREQYPIVDENRRKLKVCFNKDKTISIITNNGDFEYKTNLTYTKNQYIDINMEYDDGTLIINGQSIPIDMEETGWCSFYSTNWCCGHAFYGYLKDFRVYSYPNE